MGEFDLVRLIEASRSGPTRGVLTDLGDDAAVLEVPPGKALVTTCDTLNEGIHFHAGMPPASIGHKALAVNLSDLAAMGANPAWALLSLSLPRADREWLREFLQGFDALAARHGVRLVGGDVCRGPLSITVTMLGLQDPDASLLRSGARAGDLVIVSGTLGDAALALDELRAGRGAPPAALPRLERPEPRVALGRCLAGRATACIDLSDGLSGDLAHLSRASGCGFEIELARLPASQALGELDPEVRWRLQLGGGDDYELCFTIDRADRAQLATWSEAAGVGLQIIGHAVPGDDITFLRPDGTRLADGWYGYDHFGS